MHAHSVREPLALETFRLPMQACCGGSAMNIAYLVAAHAQPAHLSRLLERLVTVRSHAFVHLDAKSDVRQFASIKRPGVTLCVPRVPVYWAEFSQIEAALLMMRQALDSLHRYDYCALL